MAAKIGELHGPPVEVGEGWRRAHDHSRSTEPHGGAREDEDQREVAREEDPPGPHGAPVWTGKPDPPRDHDDEGKRGTERRDADDRQRTGVGVLAGWRSLLELGRSIPSVQPVGRGSSEDERSRARIPRAQLIGVPERSGDEHEQQQDARHDD